MRDALASPDTTTITLDQTRMSRVEDTVSGRLAFDGIASRPESLGVLRDRILVRSPTVSHGYR